MWLRSCNNAPFFGETNGRGGFLSQLDSQQLLTYDNLTVPGAYNDNDMLENCNVDRHDPSLSLTDAESRAQLAELQARLNESHSTIEDQRAQLAQVRFRVYRGDRWGQRVVGELGPEPPLVEPLDVSQFRL